MMRLKYTDGSPITDHLNAFQGIINQLAGMGIKFEDEIQGLWFLGTLPDTWETFRHLCPNLHQMVLSHELLRLVILNEVNTRRKSQGSSLQSDVLVTKRRRKSQSRGPSNRGAHDEVLQTVEKRRQEKNHKTKRNKTQESDDGDDQYLRFGEAKMFHTVIYEFLDARNLCIFSKIKDQDCGEGMMKKHDGRQGADDVDARANKLGRRTGPSVYAEALEDEHKKKEFGAMEDEIEFLYHENNTFELCEARLVVKGFSQKRGIDFDEIFSPVVKMGSIRVVLGLAASLDLEVEQMDVKTAFLHGDLDKEIYMEQPEGFQVKGKEDYMCRLKKVCHGLKQQRDCGKRNLSLYREEGYEDFLASTVFLSEVWPDLAHAVGVVSRFLSNPGKKHWEAIKWIFRYLRGGAISWQSLYYKSVWAIVNTQRCFDDGMFELNKVHTDDNASDMLTKAVAREKLKLPDIGRKVLTVGILILRPESPFSYLGRLHLICEVLRYVLSSNPVSYNKEKLPVLYHACQLGKHVKVPFCDHGGQFDNHAFHKLFAANGSQTNRPTQRLNLHVAFVSPLPKSYIDAFNDLNWQYAMNDEYNALIKNNTWTLISRHTEANVVRYIRCYVDETFSSVVKSGTIQTVLCLAIFWHWPIHQLDVKNAFLHGDLSEMVYMHQPLGFWDSTHPAYVCLLKRSLYGLKDAPRALFQRFAAYITRRKYATKILERAHMVGCNSIWTLVDTKSKLSDDGDLVYLYMHDPWEPHFSALKRILRYVRGILDHGLQLFSCSTTSLVAYLNANWAGCPTTWRSTSEAEYYGVANAVAETCWLRNLLRELHTPMSSDMLVYCDNVRVLHVPSRYQYADIFTKGLPTTLFKEFRTSLSVWCSLAPTTGECV
ncbi:ribonuclease H-like domain-containing protein [Tanacetum coccineum]|uniref:Ribonuclease H-like domain-containing protein n=1 Tax=Tanacetum coccineum TaxID=301880 RepID=A0ABQ4WE89_9ASTR